MPCCSCLSKESRRMLSFVPRWAREAEESHGRSEETCEVRVTK